MFKPDNIENEFFLKLGFSFSKKDLKKGKLLISEPFLGDPNFNRTVVLICEFDKADGAFGFILNKPTELYMSDIVDGFPQKAHPFHYGGPVNQETMFFIHTLGDVILESKEVQPGLYWSGNFDQLSTMIKSGQVTPNQVRFFGGYSGWDKGQLEDELKERSWIIGSMDVETLMNTPAELMWKKSLRALGSKFSIMAEFPENPELN